MTKKDDLGDRMKRYEERYKYALTDNLPVILRLDGRAFHTFTRGMEKPFDCYVINMMNEVAMAVVSDVCNARLAYIQSDEVSVLISKRSKESQFWFGNEIQKMVSVAAGVASSVATAITCDFPIVRPTIPRERVLPSFDARVFVLPEYEVTNYFIWRQNDWTRNSVQMLARSMYSQKQLHGKSVEQMHDMIHEKGHNWNELPVALRRGRCAVRNPQKPSKTTWVMDNEIPIFTEDRAYIESRVGLEEE